ncbi:MAG TPA: HD domain-containing protein [Aciduliprofundum sp.]|nr:HD domain-containing protein [Aciduliprofundum sp.]
MCDVKDVREIYDSRVLRALEEDPEVDALLKGANDLTMGRLMFNDHGKTHARIVAYFAVRAYEILRKRGIRANLEFEDGATEEEVKDTLVAAAYLHDIGNAVNRRDHELLSLILAAPILDKVFSGSRLAVKQKAVAMEAILCHMGRYPATSLEAQIVALSDGLDMERGRARIPYRMGAKSIHTYSALSISRVELQEGRERPLLVLVHMENPSGIFQIEEVLGPKIENTRLSEMLRIKAKIGEEEVVIH